MCYSVYLSTDSPDDLSVRNSELIRLERVADFTIEPCVGLLEFPYRWYVGSKSHCSCTFRHLASTELGFFEPVDWYEEELDNIDATRELYSILLSVLDKGHRIDIIDHWEGAGLEDVKAMEVSLREISEDAFLLFENYRFQIT